MSAVGLRKDHDAASLRGWPRRRRALGRRGGFWPWRRSMMADRAPTRRASVASACRPIRDWVLRFNARGSSRVFVDGKAPGQKSKLDGRAPASARRDDRGGARSRPSHGVVRWRLDRPRAVGLYDEHGVSVTKQILSRELRALGYRKLSARPRHHEKSEAAAAAFKKNFPAVVADIEDEGWQQADERSGSRTRRGSARRTRLRGGGRSAAPGPRRRATRGPPRPTSSGAICPARRKGRRSRAAALHDTQAMSLHLAEISTMVAPGAHAILVLDKAGWHVSKALGRAKQTSRWSRCPPNRPNSTPSRTSGSSCATTGCRTGSSHPTKTSSAIAARPGTSSSINHGTSCRSEGAIGLTGYKPQDLVLASGLDVRWRASECSLEGSAGVRQVDETTLRRLRNAARQIPPGIA